MLILCKSLREPQRLNSLTWAYLLLLLISLQACGGGGGNTSTQVPGAPTTPPPAVNNTPTANAGQDQQAKIGETVTFSASASKDIDGDKLSYSWKLASKPNSTSVTITSDSEVTTNLTADVAGVYILSLLVSDGTATSQPDEVKLTVTAPEPVNKAPVANAGADQEIFTGTEITFDGSNSRDPDGDPLSYNWQILTQPESSNLILNHADTARPSAKFAIAGEYTLGLIVSDASASSPVDTVNVKVRAKPATNMAPIANAGPDQEVLKGSQINLDGSNSQDPDGDNLNFSWQVTNQPATANVQIPAADSVKPSITFSVSGIYQFSLTVSDAELSSQPDMVQVTVKEPANSTELTPCQRVQKSVQDTGFNDVRVDCDSQFAYVISDTYPDHDMMNGITGTNEQIPVPAIDYAAPIKLAPEQKGNLTTIDAALGVAVNGVPIYDYSAQGELNIHQYDPATDTVVLGQLDNCGGHAGRGDDYHYHAKPTCMQDSMQNKGDNAILGWGYDGYPLYGDKNPDGSEITSGSLDVCNGQPDNTFGYRYHTSTAPPYIIQCLVGEVNTQNLPRVSPLSGDTQGIRANLKPPQGGVENLQHKAEQDGSRTMSYSYRGQNYYVTYRPLSNQSNCYAFEQKTISNGGAIETGTLCRESQSKPASVKTVSLSPLIVSRFGQAQARQVELGDGNGIDTIFRNSGVVIDESQQLYYAVNGVHPVNQGQYNAYYPKSVVAASLKDDSIVKSYPFSQVNSRNIDMEALSYGPETGMLYIGDEYNFIYKMSLANGQIQQEWNLADTGLTTNTDKGIEALSYSATNGYFYAGIQQSRQILILELGTGNSISKKGQFTLEDGWTPSGLFAHKDSSIYVLAMNNSASSNNQAIFKYNVLGQLQCQINIPASIGITRPDGLYIDANDQYLYITDSQGPLNNGSSLYQLNWSPPCN